MENHRIFFLPYFYKPIGYIIFALGIMWWFIAQQYSINLQTSVFALISSYVSTTVFSVVKTNLSDEISLILTLTGGLFIVFSKEKDENNQIQKIKLRTLFWALLINQIILIFSTLFLYGTAFIAVVLINLISLNFIYLVLLKIQIFKLKRKFSVNQSK